MQIILIAMALLSVEVAGTKLYAISPPPGDFYPGRNTAIGQQAFLFLTSGQYNTAVGFLSQAGNATANFNTAVGAGALLSNTAEGNTATGAGALLKNTMVKEQATQLQKVTDQIGISRSIPQIVLSDQ